MIRTHDDEAVQAARTERAHQLLFVLSQLTVLRPWQRAFYDTQRLLCYESGDDSYRPDAYQLSVLEEIAAEHVERIEI